MVWSVGQREQRGVSYSLRVQHPQLLPSHSLSVPLGQMSLIVPELTLRAAVAGEVAGAGDLTGASTPAGAHLLA